MAFLAFEEEHGALPMATAYRTREGKPGLSWRVALLPYLGEAELHARFHLDEPWDSPHNLALLPEMPRVYRQKPVYRFSSEPAENLRGETFYQVIRGRGFLFDGHFAETRQVAGSEWLGRALAGLKERSQRTVLLVMGRTAVPWTAPEDIDAEDGEPIGPRLMLSRGYYHLAQLDSRHGGLNKDTTEQEWRAILRIDEQ